MKGKNLGRLHTRDDFLYIGLGLTMLSWVLTSFVEAFILNDEPFFGELFPTEVDEVWERLIVAAIILLFSVYVQRTITKRKRAENELRFQKVLLEAQSEASIDGILVVSDDGNMASSNRRFAEMWGISEEVIATRSDEAALQTIQDKLANPQTFLARVAYLYEHPAERSRDEISLKDGRTFDRYSTPIRSTDGTYHGRVWFFRDVTERRRMEEQLKHQAFHDSLTDLPNRALFTDRLGHAVAKAERKDVRVAVLFMDLDNFKAVNDSLGHEGGDELLGAVARRLQSCLRPEDTLARLGGDEFTILLEDVADESAATEVAEQIAEELQAPFVVQGQETLVTTSIGIAIGDTSELQSDDALLRNADLAMYRAKNRGKAHYEVFAPERSSHAVERTEVEADLRWVPE